MLSADSFTNKVILIYCLYTIVAWGSYFDQAVAWNKHIDDENVLILIYEELEEVGVFIIMSKASPYTLDEKRLSQTLIGFIRYGMIKRLEFES